MVCLSQAFTLNINNLLLAKQIEGHCRFPSFSIQHTIIITYIKHSFFLKILAVTFIKQCMKFKLRNRNQTRYDQFICNLKKIVGLYIKKGGDPMPDLPPLM